MKKENALIRILKRIFKIKSPSKTVDLEEEKREMCSRSIYSGVCPKDCDRCAWNIMRD